MTTMTSSAVNVHASGPSLVPPASPRIARLSQVTMEHANIRSRLQQTASLPVHKTYGQSISDNKEIIKAVSHLHTVISSLQPALKATLDGFIHYSPLWDREASEVVDDFTNSSPLLVDFNAELKHYTALLNEVAAEAEIICTGPLELHTGLHAHVHCRHMIKEIVVHIAIAEPPDPILCKSACMAVWVTQVLFKQCFALF